MTKRAPSRAGWSSASPINGAPVLSSDFALTADAINHICGGAGDPIIVSHFPGMSLIEETKTVTHYTGEVIPSPWMLSVKAVGAGTLTVSVNGDLVVNAAPLALRMGAPPMRRVFEPTIAGDTVAIEFEATGAALIVELALYRVSRGTSGFGVESPTIRAGELIVGVEGDESWRGLYAGRWYAAMVARRMSMSVVTGPLPVPVDSTSFGLLGVPIPVIARRHFDEAKRAITVALVATVVGDGGEMRVTAESGDTVTVAVDGESAIGESANDVYTARVDVDVDDFGEDSHGQPGREVGDMLTIELRALDSGDEIHVVSCNVLDLDFPEPPTI